MSESRLHLPHSAPYGYEDLLLESEVSLGASGGIEDAVGQPVDGVSSLCRLLGDVGVEEEVDVYRLHNN